VGERSETERVQTTLTDGIHDSFDDAAQPGLRMRLRGEAMRLSTQHERLDTFCKMVSEALGRGSLSGARLAFMRFGDALEAHVTLEDQVFFPALRGLRPDLTEPLTRLVQEHATIRHDLEQLRDLLSAGSAEAFARDFTCLCDFIREHERSEDEVLRPARNA
jgi:iron-sulfur cluster repair protein YtfE (RIC family)